VAVKIIIKENIRKMGKVHIDLLNDELEALEELDHPHIVKVYELLEDADNIYIVMELMPDGNMLEMKKKLKVFNDLGSVKSREKWTASIIFQVASALKYMHALGRMHRDIELENLMTEIVRTSEGKPVGINIKLTDFGFATSVD